MLTEKSEPYEMWRPTVAPAHRHKLESLHANLPNRWQQAIMQKLGQRIVFGFSGFGFSTFAKATERQSNPAEIVMFSVERATELGMLVFDYELAMKFLELGLGSTDLLRKKEGRRQLTAVESAIVGEVTKTILAEIEKAYLAAGLGQLRVVQHASRYNSLIGFEPENYLAVATYEASGAGAAGSLFLAIPAKLAKTMSGSPSMAPQRWSNRSIRNGVARLPVDVEVVLRTWHMPVSELVQLRPGSLLALPAFDEAIMMAGGKPLIPVEITIEPNVTRVRAIRAAHSNGKV